MTVNVVVQPEILNWTRKRVDFTEDDLAHALGIRDVSIVYEWERTGELKMRQLEKIAEKTYTPVGYLFLHTPPVETLPIKDFRTKASVRVGRPSPNLLDTIYNCQIRQEWFRQAMIEDGQEPLQFVGSVDLERNPLQVANSIRQTIKISGLNRQEISSWEDALSLLVSKIEDAQIIVMRNGVVGNNTHRKLNVAEFRGFCLSDEYAPLIFINASDAKSAQMFTLAHELVHIWLGQSGVSNTTFVDDKRTEDFCNTVASEILVPTDEFMENWRETDDNLSEALRLARYFKVSSLVVLIKAFRLKVIDEVTFRKLYEAEISKNIEKKSKSGGGDFYRTQNSRLSKPFISTVVERTLSGKTTFTEAFQLLGVKKIGTFNKMAETVVGVS